MSTVHYDQLNFYTQVSTNFFWKSYNTYGDKYPDSFKITIKCSGVGKGFEIYYIETKLHKSLVGEK